MILSLFSTKVNDYFTQKPPILQKKTFLQIRYDAGNIIGGADPKRKAFLVFTAVKQKILLLGVLDHQAAKGTFCLGLIGNISVVVYSLC